MPKPNLFSRLVDERCHKHGCSRSNRIWVKEYDIIYSSRHRVVGFNKAKKRNQTYLLQRFENIKIC